jgi:hypothetical protein
MFTEAAGPFLSMPICMPEIQISVVLSGKEGPINVSVIGVGYDTASSSKGS